MTTHPRPLSPHLQVYKPQITSLLSILHRLTGLFLSLGSIIIVAWLFSLAFAPETYGIFVESAHSLLGKALNEYSNRPQDVEDWMHELLTEWMADS